ncbi:MAG: class I SAM-dependent methyltransferase [Micavibrio sp.]|jgi:SAM-dependent methyltransferase|nr:MAG: class I SAM-dependent methyltransferase [Micavibrio sp.]
MKQHWREFWNERYSQDGAYFGEAPLPFLAGNISVFPEKAKILLPADGDGRNGVFLARHGFDVHSFDGSPIGVEKARQAVEEYNVTINAVVSGVEDFVFAPEEYDAVVVSYFLLEPDLRRVVHGHYIDCLKPGGVLLLEGFTKDQLNYSSGGPDDPEMLLSEEILRQDFAALSIEYLEEKIDILDRGAKHQGEGAVIRMIARKPQP